MSALSELVLCLHFLPSTTQEKYRPGTSNLTVLRPCFFTPMHLPAALGVDFSGCQTSSLQSAESTQIPLIYKSWGVKTSPSSSKFPFKSQTTCSFSFPTPEVPSQSALMAITAVAVTLVTTPYSRQSAAGA